jgi:exonuclease SbcC
MKFKKVEIQAFRAYDTAQDGTFDFGLTNGENADFISIYAPNGFGKTSFYDAVEYGITKNINRFLRRGKENLGTAKSERNLSSVAKQYILRNKFSNDQLESFIKIYTTNSTEPIETKINKPSKKGGFDYKFECPF